MPVNILMPALSPTMEEGTLAKWHVKEGDAVSSGQVIAEIETDKATMEFEAVDEGRVGKIVIPEGTEGVKVNDLIAVLLEEGEDAAAIGNGAAGAGQGPGRGPAAGAAGEAAPAAAKAAPAAPVSAKGERIFASPLARRIAAERGIDLAALTGSGPNGRIVRADVEGAQPAAAKPAAAPAAAPAAKPAPAAAPAGPDAEQVKKLYADRELRGSQARRDAQDHRRAAHRGEVDDPALLSAARDPARRADGVPRPAEQGARGAGGEALGQRLRHQGLGDRAAAGARAATPSGPATGCCSSSRRTWPWRWRSRGACSRRCCATPTRSRCRRSRPR